jgi:hypothetical protein
MVSGRVFFEKMEERAKRDDIDEPSQLFVAEFIIEIRPVSYELQQRNSKSSEVCSQPIFLPYQPIDVATTQLQGP